MVYKRISIIIPLLGLMLWLLSASPARANSWPPMAIGLLQLPLAAGLVSYGLGLVAIVVLCQDSPDKGKDN